MLFVFNNMLEIVSLFDICTLHKKSYKNVDHSMCAQNWHSVSGLKHNHGLELSSPVMDGKRDE